jgi:hypothetical protein
MKKVLLLAVFVCCIESLTAQKPDFSINWSGVGGQEYELYPDEKGVTLLTYAYTTGHIYRHNRAGKLMFSNRFPILRKRHPSTAFKKLTKMRRILVT